MFCVECNSDNNIVTDSRAVGRFFIKRRRKCLDCGYKWNTYEIPSFKLPDSFVEKYRLPERHL